MAIQPTQTNPTSQQSPRGYIVDHIVLHHAATTSLEQVVGMMVSGSRQVSSNYVVKDDRIAAVVPENQRSWSLSSALWDGRSITFEICNESTGGTWPVSARSHETVARMCADICQRYGIPCNRERILGHREVYSRHGASYATACPGGLNLDWIVARANQILSGDAAPNESEFEMKQFVRCTDIANVGGQSGKSQAFVAFGPSANSKDPAVRVFHNEGIRNLVMKGRGIAVNPENAKQFAPTVTVDELATILSVEVGFDLRSDGSTATQVGGKMVDGFAWGYHAAGTGGTSAPTDLTIVETQLADIRKQIADFPKPPTTFKAA